MTRFSELRKKEVVNICSGKKLGYICDLCLDLSTGKITAIIVPGPCKFFLMFKPDCDYVIPWKNICKIGEDVILVEVDENYSSSDKCGC